MPTDQLHDQEDNALVDGASPGGMLQQARVERNLDEKWIAEHLHITVHYVKAIEGDKYEKLPGMVFARGYLKSYAKLVGLDPEAVLGVFDTMQSGQEEIKNQTRVSEEKVARDRNTRWAVASAVGLVLLIGGALYFSGPGPVDSAGTEAPVTEPAAEEPQQETQQSAAPVPDQPLAVPDPLDDATMAVIEEPTEAVEQQVLPEPAATQDVQTSTTIAQAPVDEVKSAEDTGIVTPDAQPAAEQSAESAGRNILAELAASAESDSLSDSGAEARPEDLADINVLEGENGQRIIAVDAQGEDLLRISFSGESWVEINDGEDRQIYRDLREQGDILEVSGHAPFNVLLGDAPLTQLNFNGADIDVSDNIRIDNSARLTVGL